MRATFIPASTRSPITDSVALEGPRVHTILARGFAGRCAAGGLWTAVEPTAGVETGVEALDAATAGGTRRERRPAKVNDRPPAVQAARAPHLEASRRHSGGRHRHN